MSETQIRQRNISRHQRDRFAFISRILMYIVWIIAGFTILFSLSLKLCGLNTMYVVSDSMVPTFARGDLIIMSQHYNGLAVKDIIGYKPQWADGNIVTHRIINIDGDNITVQGDNNQFPDPTFNKQLVVGEIVGITHYAGWLFYPWIVWGLAISGLLFAYLGDILKPKAKHRTK